jgi:hypothetical protein
VRQRVAAWSGRSEYSPPSMHAPRRTLATSLWWVLACVIALMLASACSTEPGGSGGTGGTSSGGSPGPAPLGCVLADGVCERDQDCCTAPCLGGFCFFVPDGEPCAHTKQCGNSSICKDGVCSPVSCRGPGQPCNGAGCCSPLACVEQACAWRDCAGVGESCSSTACCLGLDCDEYHVCQSGCGTAGAACADATGCCEGYRCVDGACAAYCSYEGCGPGADGTFIECCYASCNDGGLCEGCNPSTCAIDADCCDGAHCVDEHCQCVGVGEPCGESGACCDGQCKTGTCVCIEKGGPCTYDKECCGDDTVCDEGICRLQNCAFSGDACEHPTDCCGDPCTDGICCSPLGTDCTAGGITCCGGGRCLGEPSTCRADCLQPGQPGCTSAADCCETGCNVNGYCEVPYGGDCSTAPCAAPFQCPGGTCCLDLNAYCAAFEEDLCCEGLSCTGDRCCRPDGAACSMSTDCCTDICGLDGLCQPIFPP